MPLEHMVWIKFKDGVSEDRKAHHLQGLASLKGKVPPVRHLAVGENVTERAMGYTHGLLVTLDDAGALKEYLDHPEHLRVATPLRAEADLLAMDIVY